MVRILIIAGTVTAVVLAVVLGYTFYNNRVLNSQQPSSPVTPSQTPPTQSAPVSTASVSAIPSQRFSKTYLSSLTPNEQKLAGLEQDSEVIKQNQDLIKGVAKQTGQLDISSCEPKPLVLQLEADQEFKVTNNDNLAHTISFQSNKYKIEAKSTQILKLRLPSGKSGIIGYGCDDKSAGYFLFTE